MHNFFVSENQKQGDRYFINGTDFNHIKNVLRMNVGDTFLVSECGISNLCRIEKFEKDSVIAKILEENFNDTKLPVNICLFQGIPKGDKMELIIQKAVELGVHEIVPVEMSRCVVKIEEACRFSLVAPGIMVRAKSMSARSSSALRARPG